MVDLTKVKPLDVDGKLGKGRNRVRRIGIELEGGWSKLPPGVRLTHDGSIQFGYDVAIQLAQGQVGELPSPPLEISQWQAWVKQFYPQHVNHTCGMHVHLSFKNALTYQRLMDPRYPATIIAYVNKWAGNVKLDKAHPLWGRLQGKSPYCQHKFDADGQCRAVQKDYDRNREGNRYTVVNYSYGRHSTVECRLLPMMSSADIAVGAIQNLIDVTNAYLLTAATREEKVKAVYVATEERTRDERKIYV